MRHPTVVGLAGCSILVGACLLDAGGTLPPGVDAGGAHAGGGTTTSASGGATATGGATSTGGSGGCVPTGDEICTNGLDDDCNGDIDCADAHCADHSCIPIPSGARPATLGIACSPEYEAVNGSDCSACLCSVDDPGTCTLEVELYDNSKCDGTPATVQQTSPDGSCLMGLNVTSTESVGALARGVVQNDVSCSADVADAPATPVTACALLDVGSCDKPDTGCVPPSAPTACVLFTGDVACPSSHPKRQRIFDTTTGTCDCQCSSGYQTCPTDEVARAWTTGDCTGGGSKHTDVDSDEVCVDTGFAIIQSLDNASSTIVADSAGCNPDATVQGAAILATVCCSS